jgi:WD40 repeat protein
MHDFKLAVASDHLRVWDLKLPTSVSDFNYETTTPAWTVKKQTHPVKVAWSSSFDSLFAAYRQNIHIQDIQGGLIEEIIPSCLKNTPVFIHASQFKVEDINTLAIGYKSSRNVYYAGSNKVVRIWDRVEKKQTLLTGHKSAINSLGLSTDDQRLASGSATGDVIVFSLKHGTRSILNSPFKQGVNQTCFYPFKKSVIMAAGDDGCICIWDIHQKLEPWQLKREAHLGPIMDVAFAPCNKHLYCSVGLDKVVKFHDIQQSGKSYELFL